MVGILIITHGELAEALISTAELIIGNLKMTRGISIGPQESIEQVKDRIQKEMTKVDEGDAEILTF